MMMYILYNTTSGEIICSRNNLQSIERQLQINGKGFEIAKVEGYVVNLHTHYKNGELIEISEGVKRERFMDNLRFLRNQKLSASDWTQVPDAPVDQAAWAAYRQALRDLPDKTTDPANPVWPTPPQ